MSPVLASQRDNMKSFPGETGWESEQVGSPDAPSAYNHLSTFRNFSHPEPSHGIKGSDHTQR